MWYKKEKAKGQTTCEALMELTEELQVDILVVGSFGRKGERMYDDMASAVLPSTVSHNTQMTTVCSKQRHAWDSQRLLIEIWQQRRLPRQVDKLCIAEECYVDVFDRPFTLCQSCIRSAALSVSCITGTQLPFADFARGRDFKLNIQAACTVFAQQHRCPCGSACTHLRASAI